MESRKIREFKFYFKPESVTMVYHSQQVCFHNFKLKNKKKLGYFTNELKQAREMDLNKVFGLARRYDLPSMNLITDIDPKLNKARIGL